jgi:hypothetical protein
MVVKAVALIAELRTIIAGQHGEPEHALRTLAARTLELAELVQAQDEKIKELMQRLDLRSR